MKTNRQAVSDVIGGLNALNIDEQFSSRMILSYLRDSAAKVIDQQSDNRRLYQKMDLWTPIPSLPLEPVTILDWNVRRSTARLPNIYDTTYGEPIRVFSVNNHVELVRTTPHEYHYKLHRRFKDKSSKYYWLEDRYLYVVDEDAEDVKVSGLFVEPQKARLLDRNAVQPACIFPLDDLFVCPEDMIADVIALTVSKLAATVQIKAAQDNTPDENSMRR